MKLRSLRPFVPLVLAALAGLPAGSRADTTSDVKAAVTPPTTGTSATTAASATSAATATSATSGTSAATAKASVAPVSPGADSTNGSQILVLREAYERAWTLKHNGDSDAAALAAERALEEIQTTLAGNPDATTRRELTDLQGRYEGLRDALAKEQEAPSTADSSNDADADVLSATAIDEIEPQFNSDVYKYIDYFTGNGRSTFERWLKRSGRYMNLFRSILQREGLPPDLVHLVFVESGFNLNARSVSAAVGPWQFLRSSARMFGLDVNQWVDERKDPEKSTVAAARYLKHLYSIFGDWPLALASYNAGEGTVLRAIKRQGTTNYWDLKLPRQTEDYVPQFMAVLAISRDPEKYGFDNVDLDEPMEFDEVALKGSVDLRSLARLSECSTEELKQLNPAVVRHAVPGKDGVTTVRLPRGKGEVLSQKLAEGAKLPKVDLTVRHRVRRGETLSGIAGKYHVSAQRLAQMNDINRKNLLRVGTTLTIPTTQAAAVPVLADASDPRASTAYVPPRDIKTPAQIDGQSEAAGRSTHVVRRGQTLASIAQQYGCTVSDIKRWNRLTSNHVRRGTHLKIRSDVADSTGVALAAADSAQIASLRPPTPHRRRAATSRMAGRTIVVQRGDTLSELAKRHGVSVAALKRVNGLRGSMVRAGQRLRLPSS